MRLNADRPYWRAALWLRRQRVLGRRRFIWAWLIPRFALPITLAATLLRTLFEPFAWPHFLLHVLVNVVVAGGVGGYVAGSLLWELMVAGRKRR